MFIEEIDIYKCTRFALNQRERLVIRPSEKVQIILGTNGSGKSSLLEIGFNVLPPNASDFQKGGHRIQIVRHRNKRYKLTVTIKSTTECSFIDLDTGEELNRGTTQGEQRQLIESIFGITPAIQDVLLDRVRFTQMTPQKRQEWITRLAEADFEYALEYYGKIKRAGRETQAVLKHQSTRLATEQGKCLDSDEIEAMRLRATKLRADIETLLSRRVDNPEDPHSVHTRLQKRMAGFMADTSALIGQARKMTLPVTNPRLTPERFTDIRDAIGARVGELKGACVELSKEHAHLETRMYRLKQLECVDIALVTAQLHDVDQLIAQTQQRIAANPYFPTGVTYHPAFADRVDAIQMQLLGCGAVPTVDQIRDLRARLDTLQGNIAQWSQSASEARMAIEHWQQCESVSCPNCNHTFKPGSGSPEAHADTVEHLQHLESQLATAKSQQHELQVQLHEAQSIRHAAGEISQYMQQHSDMVELWGALKYISWWQAPPTITNVLNDYRAALVDAKQLLTLRERREPLVSTLDAATSITDDGLEARYIDVVARLAQLQTEQSDEQKTLQLINRWGEHTRSLEQQYDRCVETLYAIEQDLYVLSDAVAQQGITSLLDDEHAELSTVSTALSRSEIQQGLVEDIRRDVGSLSLDDQAYRIIHQALNPKDGLIAQQITMHIGRLVDRMNRIIAKIWGYPMRILPCGTADGSLDYRFPVYKADSDHTVDDISEGSRSQVDIINQAFRMVAYRCLGLEESILYLDEFGSSFDELHRSNLVSVLEEIFEDPQYAMVAMISHYLEGYDGFTAAQCIVTDDRHVTLSRPYNQHVEFT